MMKKQHYKPLLTLEYIR